MRRARVALLVGVIATPISGAALAVSFLNGLGARGLGTPVAFIAEAPSHDGTAADMSTFPLTLTGGDYTLHARFGPAGAFGERRPADPTTNQDEAEVNVILAVLSGWGACPPGPCPGDVDSNGVVDLADLILVTKDGQTGLALRLESLRQRLSDAGLRERDWDAFMDVLDTRNTG